MKRKYRLQNYVRLGEFQIHLLSFSETMSHDDYFEIILGTYMYLEIGRDQDWSGPKNWSF